MRILITALTLLSWPTSASTDCVWVYPFTMKGYPQTKICVTESDAAGMEHIGYGVSRDEICACQMAPPICGSGWKPVYKGDSWRCEELPKQVRQVLDKT